MTGTVSGRGSEARSGFGMANLRVLEEGSAVAHDERGACEERDVELLRTVPHPEAVLHAVAEVLVVENLTTKPRAQDVWAVSLTIAVRIRTGTERPDWAKTPAICSKRCLRGYMWRPSSSAGYSPCSPIRTTPAHAG